MPSERDYRTIEKAALYDLRLLIDASEKETYTKPEILELIDQIARTKDQS